MEDLVYLHGLNFTGCIGSVTAERPEEVVPALELVEKRVAQGLHAAGFVSYEAATALNGDLTTCVPGDFPLVWFGLFRQRTREPFPQSSETYRAENWETALDREGYAGNIAAIRDLIRAGDSYQVNFTMRQRFSFSGSPRSYFNDLCRSQPTPYSSYLELGNHRILSASPELFFAAKDGVLTTRPMKGTGARGRWLAEDLAEQERLRSNPKELAENLMIVDLLRNDMGMISETGSVEAVSLFDVETHPSVHQMTSTIRSRVKPGVGTLGLFRALFPCGSVTGAPKRRSMEIIAQLEGTPRGLYTGCLGYLAPGGEAQFSVAIRTLVLDAATGQGELGIGSGVTFDSAATSEYAECLGKGRFAREKRRDFHLIESLLYDGGYFLLERHLERLAGSAAYFDFPLETAAARDALEAMAQECSAAAKVRLLLFPDGRLSCESAPIVDQPQLPRVGFAGVAVNSENPLLYHKTSCRELYAGELARRPELGDVLFENERGEVTEATSSNVVVRLNGELCTPPLASGLLPGVFRAELLARGTVKERLLTRDDLARGEELYLINSVRKWRAVQLVG